MAAAVWLFGVASNAAAQNCIYIFQDETDAVSPAGERAGPERTIALANLLGHWPHYEVRVRPIGDYRAGQTEECRATLYLGTSAGTEVPASFLNDFSRTQRPVAWLGLGAGKLERQWVEKTFRHRVGEVITVAKSQAQGSGYFNRILYKKESFGSAIAEQPSVDNILAVERYLPAGSSAAVHVLAWQVNDKTVQRLPYFLQARNKYLIAGVPFEARDMRFDHRSFPFADLLFDILNEPPRRIIPIAFARLEDIDGFYDLALFQSALSAFRAERVPVNVAHIPFFVNPTSADPMLRVPRPAMDAPAMARVLTDLQKDPRNAILWHGVTHQLGDKPNPATGISGDDFEFWDAVSGRPVPDDSPQWVLNRLATALPVFEAYGRQPRFWETPHYRASALDNVVFGRVFPWTVGGAVYYASSFGASFTLAAVNAGAARAMPGVREELLDKIATESFAGADLRSTGQIDQPFPFEIYRDVYGQRIVPETLGYVAGPVAGQPASKKSPDDILEEARRNRVLRDVWGSFFFHPFLLTSKENGGIGAFPGDAGELRRLLAGLKKLGYRFVPLNEFESGAN